jgi:predicted permease
MTGRRSLREWLRRLWGSLRRVRSDADLQDELRSHLAFAAEDAERRGQTPEDARRISRVHAGGVAQAMDALRDQRGLPTLDALASDVLFGLRQLNKHRVASLAAILSLGLAIGATTAAFRLIDAVLLRPLPVADPDRLFVVTKTFVDSENRPDYDDDFDYPTYREYVKTAAAAADLMLVGAAFPNQVVFGGEEEPELLVRQYLSGNVFAGLGLQPALGRLIGPADDVTPGAHPVAVISYDYWSRRFGRDPAVIGARFRTDDQQFEIVGVAPKGFTGTEPGNLTDLYVPAMMNVRAIDSPGWSWFRIWVRPKPGFNGQQVREVLHARFRADHLARLKHFPSDTPKQRIDTYLAEEVRLLPAGSGVSAVQKAFRRPLAILAALAGVVLLIACGNVANLLIARGMSRTREIALRVSIGATRGRLVQLLLVESTLLATLASVLGALFASWSIPLVVPMLAPTSRPVRLILDPDWRVLAFAAGLTLAVAVTFGLVPALRASAVKPIGVLKGHADPHSRRRLTHALTGAQVAFCVFCLFAATIFIATFGRLVGRPLGFAHERVLLLPVESRSKQPPHVWRQVADHLRQTSGVESVTLAGWAPLSGNRWRASVHVDDRGAEGNSPYFVDVSRGYFDTMRIPLIEGRDFRAGDLAPRTNEEEPARDGVGIVNEAFARAYFDGRSPLGRRVRVRQNKKLDSPMEIVGVVRDAAYHDVRETLRPTVYVPLGTRDGATVLVRTQGQPMGFAAGLRREVSKATPDVRARAAEPLSGLVAQQMIRERLLATLSGFFASVALLLAAIGLYGVLNYSVTQQRREIGIRMALGAAASQVVKHVTLVTLAIVCAGTLAGLAGGLAFARVVESLLFQVSPTGPATLLWPLTALAVAGLLAALPPAIRAVRIDPAQTLRTD